MLDPFDLGFLKYLMTWMDILLKKMCWHHFINFHKNLFTQSAEAVEYTDCTSTEG